MAHSDRFTLPPLHSLDLPRENIQLPPLHQVFHDLDEQTRRMTQLRISATSPQSHELSPSPPPSRPSLRPLTNKPASAPASTTTFPMRRIRLVHTSFEDADAILLVTPPTSPNTTPPQPLLLVGPALRRKRHLAKGTRMHPYRIVRGPSDRPPATR